MFNFNCPRCGKYFYGEIPLINHKAPIHCPGCDTYFEYDEYIKYLHNEVSGTTLARMNKPITKENMFEIIYIPKKV